MSTDDYSTFQVWSDGKNAATPNCLLPLSPDTHKGRSGRIAIVGGSARYTGAPYYAATAALRTGADLATVFTAEEAALPLKSYSPELMVQSVYSAAEMDRLNELRQQQRVHNKEAASVNEEVFRRIQHMVDAVTENLDRIHCLVIGPGMGRCPLVMRAVSKIMIKARQQNVYMVLDADALFLLAQPEYRFLLKGYDRAILTPNVMEYQRLYEGLEEKEDDPFESVTVVQKGAQDKIGVPGSTLLMMCAEEGGLKRSGGIGDVLSGTLGTLAAWQAILHDESDHLPLACWTACCIVKRATRRAFRSKRRAMSATDVLDELGATMDEMEGVE